MPKGGVEVLCLGTKDAERSVPSPVAICNTEDTRKGLQPIMTTRHKQTDRQKHLIPAKVVKYSIASHLKEIVKADAIFVRPEDGFFAFSDLCGCGRV